jgi:hypothetical protein
MFINNSTNHTKLIKYSDLKAFEPLFMLPLILFYFASLADDANEVTALSMGHSRKYQSTKHD